MCRSFAGRAGRVLALRVEMVDTLRGSSASGEPRVGFVQDFTDNVLRLAIQRFSALYPLVKLEVAVDL
jgi:DNA-binding transcriptional LysR family regulator